MIKLDLRSVDIEPFIRYGLVFLFGICLFLFEIQCTSTFHIHYTLLLYIYIVIHLEFSLECALAQAKCKQLNRIIFAIIGIIGFSTISSLLFLFVWIVFFLLPRTSHKHTHTHSLPWHHVILLSC